MRTGKIRIGLAVTAALCACSVLLHADAQPKPKTGPGQYTLVGNVTGAQGNALVVQRTGGNVKSRSVQVVADQATVIESAGKPAPASAVTVGRKVQVKGKQFDGATLLAVRIKILAADGAD